VTGFVYLAVVLDLVSRRVVEWKVSRDADAGLAVEALRRALAIRSPPHGMIHHSDRGVHYACNEYRALLDGNGIACSMSRKGDCCDNAVAESSSRRSRSSLSATPAGTTCTISSVT